MPSKAQRAASRQARLSRRRRRGKAAPQNFQAGPTRPAAANGSAVEAQGTGRSARQASAVQARPASQRTSSARSAPRSRRRVAEAVGSNASRYLGRELRQIGGVTALIAVIFVGLTFVLG